MKIATTIRYSGPYTTLDGRAHIAEDMELEYVDQDSSDRGDDCWVDAAPAHKLDGEENIISIDRQLWAEACCEQSGGHNFIDQQWSEEPESACQICTRCGKEIDPA